MPLKMRRVKGGKVAVRNTATGNTVTYGSRLKAEVGKRMRLATEHGFQATGGKTTGRIVKAAKAAARKRKKR